MQLQRKMNEKKDRVKLSVKQAIAETRRAQIIVLEQYDCVSFCRQDFYLITIQTLVWDKETFSRKISKFKTKNEHSTLDSILRKGLSI